jgi:hypothetical protein
VPPCLGQNKIHRRRAFSQTFEYHGYTEKLFYFLELPVCLRPGWGEGENAFHRQWASDPTPLGLHHLDPMKYRAAKTFRIPSPGIWLRQPQNPRPDTGEFACFAFQSFLKMYSLPCWFSCWFSEMKHKISTCFI